MRCLYKLREITPKGCNGYITNTISDTRLYAEGYIAKVMIYNSRICAATVHRTQHVSLHYIDD